MAIMQIENRITIVNLFDITRYRRYEVAIY